MNLELKPTENTIKQLVVLMHGVGSNCYDMFPLCEYFQKTLPDAYFFVPDGIEPFDQMPFGYQWYSIQNKDLLSLQEEQLRVKDRIISLIDNKLKELNIGYENLILMGFSQGAMTAIYLSLIMEKKFICVISFSGLVIKPRDKVNNFKIPICFIHGREDDVVPASQMEQSLVVLKDIPYEVHILKYLQHSIDNRALDIANRFLIKHAL